MDKFGESANNSDFLWKRTASTPQVSFRRKYKWVGILKCIIHANLTDEGENKR